MPREEARLSPRQIGPPLPGEQFAIYVQITDHHFQALLERIAGDLPVLHIDIFRERHTMRQRPGVAVAGLFVDLLGPLETLARTPLRKLEGAYGIIQVIQPEELLVERVLVSVYPQPYPSARGCAKKLAAVALGGAMEFDWKEIRRLAGRLEYRILPECRALVREVANELNIKSPLDPY